MKKVNKQSKDIFFDLVSNLKELYPALFSDEGNIDRGELENLIKGFASTASGKYEFNWAGKMSAKRNAYKISRANLKPDKSRSIDFDKTKNLILEGDNLEVLKLLQKSYFNKVKVIYIDPPYNTGNDFIYSDNFTEGKQAYWEQSGTTANGVKMDTNTESQGRYHSNWLNMMYPRLLLARNLLKEDGVIFVSIDDNEVHNLRKVMDEVFGEENFIAQLVVQTNPRGRSLDRHFAKTLEYIIVYGKTADENSSIYEIQKDEKALSQYNKVDEHGEYRLLELRNRNPVFTRKNRPNLYYPIYVNHETGGVSLEKSQAFSIEALPLNSKQEEGCWTWGKLKFTKEKELLVGQKASTGVWRIYRKDYIPSNGATTKEKSLWIDSALNHENGKEEVASLFKTSGSNIPFDFPKSVEYLRKVVNVSTSSSKNCIVLDFFAGSGTTAHAVMDLNKEDGGNRRYILVQIPEATDEKSEAYKAGYKTISDICIERVKRVSEKIKNESDGKLLKGNENIDLGFKVFSLSPSYFPENLFAPDPDKSEEENKKAFEEHIIKAQKQLKFKFEEDFLLYEILLKDGFELNFNVEILKEFKKNKVMKVSDGLKEALVCMDISLDDKTLEMLDGFKDSRFICLERAVDTTKKWNLKNMFGRNLWVA